MTNADQEIVTEVAEDILPVSESVVASVRALMLAAAVSDAEAAEHLYAKTLIDRATEVLSTRRLPVGRRYTFDRAAIALVRDGQPWQVFSHNPLGIPLRITIDDATASATVRTSALFDGPPELLHGGFAAAMLDALLSTLVQGQGARAVTVRLDLSFLAAAPTGTDLVLGGTIVSTKGRRVRADGWIRQGDTTVVTAEGLFITIAGDPD
jgi:acyl-coenzyme A thioesterase PaaI-like protein